MFYNLFLFSGFFFIFMSFLFFCMSIYMIFMNMVYMVEWDFFFFSLISMEMFIYLDFFFFCMSSIVSFISGSVIFYSYYYMKGLKFNTSFMFLLICFILSMLIYIISPSIISMFLGWDGLGLVSYLLVNYYSNKSSLNSGMLTVLSNRLGDVFLLVGVYMSVMMGGWKFLLWDNFEGMLIFIMAAFTKSAQLPFSSWLPFAMSAPTPVSSLVHSSTLVTAGVFLMFRMFYLLNDSNLYFIFSSGIITMLVSSVCGIFESDLKKVIALSTLSQLGMMLTILGLGFSDFCFFHVIMHALFKSSLFMSMGSKIHDFANFQDSRYLSSMWKNSGIDFFFGVTNLALIGFPFLSGFFSKDLSIEFLISYNINFMLWSFFIISITLTVGYSLKFMMLGSLNFNNFISAMFSNNKDNIFFYSVILLLMLSVTFGFIYVNMFLDFYLVMDMVMFIKLSMIMFLYYLYLFIWNYMLNKNIMMNKFLSFFSYLLFLNKLFIWFSKYMKDYMSSYKVEDTGYLDLFKCMNMMFILMGSFIYLEYMYFFSIFMFMMINIQSLISL